MPGQRDRSPGEAPPPARRTDPDAAGHRNGAPRSRAAVLRTALLTLAGLLTVLVVVLAVLNVVAVHHPSPGAPPTTAPATPAAPPAGSVPAAPAPAGSVPTGEAPTVPPSVTPTGPDATAAPDPRAIAALHPWLDNGGSALVDSIAAGFAAVDAASTREDLPALNAACAALGRDTRAAQAYAPLPDRAAQAHWSAGLTAQGQATADCVAATAGPVPDVTLLDQSKRELDDATAQLQQTTIRLHTLAAHSTTG